MNRITKLGFLLITFLGLGLASCLKPQEFPIEPVVSYKDFGTSGDSAFLYIEFTDGDGDIGLGENELDPPYDTASQFYYNLFMNYYEMVNGSWVQGQDALGDPIKFNYRVPVLTPEGKNKALKGEIRVFLQLYYNPFSPDNDTIKWDFQLADRALHLSNVGETTMIIR